MKYLLLLALVSLPLFATEKTITIDNGCEKIEYTKVESKESNFLYRTYLGKAAPSEMEKLTYLDYQNRENGSIFACLGLGRVLEVIDEKGKPLKDIKGKTLRLIDEKGKPTTDKTYLALMTFDDGNGGRTLYCDFVAYKTPTKIVPILEWKNNMPKPRRFNVAGKEYVEKETKGPSVQSACMHM